jgi:fructokinase
MSFTTRDTTPNKPSAVICLGEALIDFVADTAGVSLAECPGFRKAPGGAPANVAVGLARLGVAAAFVGKVGDDPFGHFLRDTFTGAGVDTRPMLLSTEARTGLAFVSLMANGERDFMFYRDPSADMLLRWDEIPESLFEDARIFHHGSITLIAEPGRTATVVAAAHAREAGCLVSYDVNLRLPLWESEAAAREGIKSGLIGAHIVKVSEEEGEFLFDTPSPEETAAKLLIIGARLAVVTRGAAGVFCRWWSDGHLQELHVPGFRVEAVDTTGAGDGFVAALLAGLLAEPDLETVSLERMRAVLTFANAVGALTCTRKGAIPALPTRAEAEQFLAMAGADDEVMR